MPEDQATLADALTSNSNTDSVGEKSQPASDTSSTNTSAQATVHEDSEAAELGSLLLQQGYTKDKVNELLEAPGALSALRFAIQNDPKEFMRMLERADPDTAQRFHQGLADLFVERYDRGEKTPAKEGEKDPSMELRFKALEEKANLLENEQRRRDAAIALASARANYSSRADQLFDALKDVSLNKSEKAALRARLDSELSKDQSIVERVSRGNYVDMPRVFKGIVEEWSADKKATIKAEEDARERQQKGAFAGLSAGPESTFLNSLTQEVNKVVESDNDPNWEGTILGMGKALEAWPK